MTLAEFKDRIDARIAAGIEPRQRIPTGNDNFQVGDIVRYTVDFQRRVNGYVEDIAGEVVVVNGRMIRVRWDDGNESSVLDSNLEKPMPPEPIDYAAFAEHERRQMLIAVDRSIVILEAWNRETLSQV